MWLLNTGVDYLLSIVYRLDLFLDVFKDKLEAALEDHKNHPDMKGIDPHIQRAREAATARRS